jgi:hypothetical protein
MAAPNPEQFRGLDPGFYMRKKRPSRAWADQESVSYTYQDELGYGGTMDVSDRTEREQPTMTRDEATVAGLDTGLSAAYNNDGWNDGTLSRDPVYDQVEGKKTEVGAQGQLFMTNPDYPNPNADTFHGNYRGRQRAALLGVLAGVHERKHTGPLSVYTGMSELSRNMVLKVGQAAERHGINFVANLDAQHTNNPAADYTDADRREYSGSGRSFNTNLEGGGRSEVPNAFYVNSVNVAPEGVEPEYFQEQLDAERERQEARLTPQEGYNFRGVATSEVREEAEMIKFSDSQVKESYEFLRSIRRDPEPEPAPERLLRRHRIYDDPEDLESPSNRRSMTGQDELQFPEWTPLERALTAGRNRARGELKAMARKSTRRPSQIEQPTVSQPAPTLRETVQNLPRETVEELAAQEEVAYSQGYDHGITDSGVVDPVEEGALYGENLQGGGGRYGFENLPSSRDTE